MKGTRALASIGAMLLGGLFIVSSLNPVNYNNVAIGTILAVAGFVFLGRGLSRGRGEKAYVALDFVAVVLIGLFFLIMVLGALAGLIAKDQPTQNVTQFLLIMAFGGLVMAFISQVLRFGSVATRSQLNQQLLYIAGNFGAFLLLNLIVPPSTYRILGLSITGSSPIITILISVPEEIVFHIWLAPWLANISKTGAIGGSFMQAIIATAYHFFVLGTNPAALGIVFGAFFIAGYTAMKSKLASVTLADHILNNASSVFAGI